MDLPLVSIIIPVYKTEKYLREALDSALNQTYEHTEIIVVNDGSPDGSQHIIDEYQQKYERITAILKENGGLSDARNAGMARAGGVYYVFFDSDDVLEPRAVEHMVELAERFGCDAVFPDRYIQANETGSEELRFHFTGDMFSHDPVTFGIEVLIARGRAWRAHSLLYRARVIREHQLQFPVGITSEDIFFNLDFLRYAKTIECLPQVTVRYMRRAGSITTVYRPGFFNTILKVDDRSRRFLVETGRDTKENRHKCDSLLMRNTCEYLKSVEGPGNRDSRPEKDRTFDSIIRNERVLNAARSELSQPYFTHAAARVYFRLMYGTIRHRMFQATKILAFLASRLS